MLSRFTSFLILFAALCALCVSDASGSCLPCIQPAKRLAASNQGSAFSSREVYSPKVTSPTYDTIWTSGSNVVVTWDLSDMPPKVTNPSGTLILGWVTEDEPNNEHLDLRHPLAKEFDIRAGNVSVKVPKVSSRRDYIVVLFGDSGNRSPPFTIKA